MMQVLTKLEQTGDERNQETSNLQLRIIRLVLWTLSSVNMWKWGSPIFCAVVWHHYVVGVQCLKTVWWPHLQETKGLRTTLMYKYSHKKW